MIDQLEYTFADLLESWDAGYRHGVEAVEIAVEDAALALIPLPRLTYEERVAQRIALFEQCAAAVARQIAEERAGLRRPGPWRCTW